MSARRVTAALDPCSNLVKRGIQAYSESIRSPIALLGSRSWTLMQNGRKSGSAIQARRGREQVRQHRCLDAS